MVPSPAARHEPQPRGMGWQRWVVRLFREYLVAEADALITNVDPRAGDEALHLVLLLPTKRADHTLASMCHLPLLSSRLVPVHRRSVGVIGSARHVDDGLQSQLPLRQHSSEFP